MQRSAAARRWLATASASPTSRLMFLPPQMLTSPASSLRRRAAGAAPRRPPPPPPPAAAARAASADAPPAPWLVASVGSLGRARVLRVAERGLGRLTRNLAALALDKEASLASGRLTPMREVVAVEGEGGAQRAAAAGGAAAARRRRGGGGGDAVAADARAAAQRGAYLGDEARNRIQGTFSTFTQVASEGVSAVLAGKLAQQAARGQRAPKETLALLMDEAKARGVHVPRLQHGPEMDDLMEGAAALREAGYVRPGTRQLPRVWAAARLTPAAEAAARAAAASTPTGVVMDYMAKNREQLVDEARAIGWPGRRPKRGGDE
jgi:hypothetical protein